MTRTQSLNAQRPGAVSPLRCVASDSLLTIEEMARARRSARLFGYWLARLLIAAFVITWAVMIGTDMTDMFSNLQGLLDRLL
jgi:hypothetical protein